MPALTTIQLRRGTSVEWAAATSPLAMGEMGYDTTVKKFKIGDGTSLWSSLDWTTILPSEISEIIDDRVASLIVAGSNITTSYNDVAGTLTISGTAVSSVTAEDVQDIIGAALVAGSGISVVYNDVANTITISLSDPTIQLADITDLSANARTFLSTPSSANLATLVSDETGTGALVFGTNPTLTGVTVSGNITVTGNGLVASNINNFDTQVRTNRLDQMAVPTASVSLNSQKITNLAEPTLDSDAATKAYVDAARSGLDVKQSVRVATTANITLSGTQTIDGISVIAGDRVLVKDQTTGSQNGIYVVAAGSWTRATDADTNTEVTAGMFTFVTEGTVNADSGWVLTTNDAITLGTTVLTFAQFSGAGQITAGAGLTKNGNTIDVATASIARIVVNADSIDLATVTQSDSAGSAGATFVQSVTRDSYGRVTGLVTASVQDASTTAKGIASFDTNSFTVTSGAVSIKTGGISNSQLANSSTTIGTTAITLGSSSTALAGLTSVTATTFTGSLTGNASSATRLATARTINGTSFDGTANITIGLVDGGTP
jgi:hypothetical protein